MRADGRYCRLAFYLERLAEQAAINLALAAFEIDAVDRAVEISQFALFDALPAECASNFLHGTEHFLFLHFLLHCNNTGLCGRRQTTGRSEAHTPELQSLIRHSYDIFCLTKKKNEH